jgi:two-component system response regulator NreC
MEIFDSSRANREAFATVVSTNPIRLLLVDDKLLVRDGVRALLEEQPGFDVIGQAASLSEAIRLDIQPDVVITDLVLPDARGNELVNSLRRVFADAAIFVLTDVDVRAGAEPIVQGAVDGYMLKSAQTAEFLAGVRSVALGMQYLQPSLHAVPDPDDSNYGTFGSLTTKEREVLRLLVLGHTNAEIASLCAVSLRTVEARRARVLHKLGVRTRAELVRAANHGRSDFELA